MGDAPALAHVVQQIQAERAVGVGQGGEGAAVKGEFPLFPCAARAQLLQSGAHGGENRRCAPGISLPGLPVLRTVDALAGTSQKR